MRPIVNKTLIISNQIFEKLGCGALCHKAYVSKDDESKLYIKANSLLIDSVNDFIQPRFEYWEHKNENINHKLILDDIQLNNEIRVYIPQSINTSPLSIKSLFGNEMIVTLKDGNLWFELVCEAVEIIMGHPKPMVKVYIPQYIHTPPYQSSTISTFRLGKQYERINIDRSSYRELCFVQFSTEFLYSIEVKGKNNIPPRQLNEDESDVTWRIGSITLSQIQLSVSFDRKIISGNYYSGIDEFGGRRTSNGWESKYSEDRAFYYKTFELIYDIQKYIDDLPIRVEAINAVVQINDVLDNELCQKEIIVKFKEQITLERISEILELDIRGIEYTYYE